MRKEKEKLASVNKSVQTMNKNISDITVSYQQIILKIFITFHELISEQR